MNVHSEQDRIEEALGLLAADQWEITPVPGMGVMAIRRWNDESVDTVLVLSPDTTYARRDDAAKRLMWQRRGTVERILRAAQDLPPPGTPDAPRGPIPDPTPDWSV